MFDEADLEPTLPAPPSELRLVSLLTLYTSLNRLFGQEKWLSYEPETLSLHIGVRLDDLTLDKIEVVRTLLVSPEVQDNASFLLHAVDVVNNHVADFEHTPMPTSLELAYYIVALKEPLTASKRPYKPGSALRAIATYLLTEDGFSEPLEPFEFLGAGVLKSGQTSGDTAAKRQAIDQYIEHMRGH